MLTKIPPGIVLTQAQMVASFYHKIMTEGQDYSKFKLTLIRPGIPGEVIETVVESGLETTKVVSPGEYVVRALTKAGEEYVITAEKFLTRYEELNEPLPEGVPPEFKLYTPTGKIKGLKASVVMEGEVWFIAPWGEKMRLLPEDILAVPLGLKPEIYRIAWAEFLQTYK
jgi:hypothetical protein